MPTFDINLTGNGVDVPPHGSYHYAVWVGGSGDFNNLNTIGDDTYIKIWMSFFCSGGSAADYGCYAGDPFIPAYSVINSVTLTSRLCVVLAPYPPPPTHVYCKVGGVTYAGSTVNVNNNVWTVVQNVWATNPAGGSWTAAAINAMQWGFYFPVVDYCSSGYFSGCSYLHVIVDYTVPPILVYSSDVNAAVLETKALSATLTRSDINSGSLEMSILNLKREFGYGVDMVAFRVRSNIRTVVASRQLASVRVNPAARILP